MKELMKHLKDIRVLYVEDEPSIREELEFFLKRRVKELYLAQNGEEGFEKYKEHKPDLVITDLQMPKLDGIGMSKLIRGLDKNAKIVVITAFNDADYLFEAIKLNISNYLTKPLDLKILIETLAEIAKNINLEKENKKIINTFEQYKSIVDERSIVSKADKNGNITYVNEPFIEISGYTKDELIGNPHNIVRHEDTPKETFKDMWDTILSKKVWSGKIKNRKKNGDYYIVDTIIKPILDVDGEIEEFIALRTDITEIESSKEYFKNKNEKTTTNLKETIRMAKTYKDAIDKSNIIIRVDLDKNITFVNDAFHEISGYSKEEVIGKPYSILKSPNVTTAEYEELINHMVETLNSGCTWEGKVSNIAKDGTVFHCKTTVFPLYDKSGNIYEYMGIRHDITDIEILHRELEDTQRELIYRLGEVGETRSKETGNHVKRVANYSRLLAKKYGLSNEESTRIFAASPMHDIGKIGIPDSILNKPAKLDDEEWKIMKTHTQIGYDILKGSEREILKAAAIISYTHHEKWDGSGYPKGHKGEDIHLYGRITAVADVFDALGSDRVYKQAWPLEKIINFFNEQKGIHFDPKLIDIFMDNLDEFLEIRDIYKD